MYIVFFVLDDPSELDDVIDAWERIGVTGVTIIESTGINRLRRASQVGASFMAGINRLMSGEQESHLTLITIVKNEEIVNQCLQSAEEILGSLDEPNTGVLAAWPLTLVKGVPMES